VEDKERRYSEIIGEVRTKFNFMPWAPIVTVSAITGQRTHKIWELVERCATSFQSQFTTRQLNEILRRATAYVNPPTRKGKTATVKYVTQTGTRPPTLSLFVNDPDLFHFSYRRFLTNQFYRQLGVEGTPLILRFRRKAPPRGWERHASQAAIEASPADVRRYATNYYGKVYTNDGDEYAEEFDLSQIPEMDDEAYERYYDADDDGGDEGDDE
jgi:hypothetical protein